MGRREGCWAAGITLALHAGFLCWAWSESSPQMATTSVVYANAVLLPDMPNTPSNPSPGTMFENSVLQQGEASARMRSRSHTVPSPPSAYITPEKPSSKPEPIGYLPFEAVDQPAEPLGDWMIDTSILPAGRPLRVILKLWISAAGTIDHWALEGVSDEEDALLRKALNRLPETLIQPAFLNHVPVPSFRQLEMVLIH